VNPVFVSSTAKTALLALLALSLTSVASFGKPAAEQDPYVLLHSDDVLHIRVIDNLASSIGHRDRFRRIHSTIDDVLEELDFPLVYEVNRFSSRKTPMNQPRLDIYIWKWGPDGFSDVEVRFSASIRREYDRDKLGVFSFSGGSMVGTSDQIIRSHDRVLRKALEELALMLNERLTMGLMEEIDSESSEDQTDDSDEIEF